VTTHDLLELARDLLSGQGITLVLVVSARWQHVEPADRRSVTVQLLADRLELEAADPDTAIEVQRVLEPYASVSRMAERLHVH
jgi:hypothetical protein